VSRFHTQELLRGLIDPLLLFLIDIASLPVYGYQLLKEIEERSQGYFRLSGSTVYSALRRLEKEGLVLSCWQKAARKQKRRCYEITEEGRRRLTGGVDGWQRFSNAADSVIKGGISGS